MSETTATRREGPSNRGDWDRLKPMTDEEVSAAAEADPDCPPLTEEELARMRRVPDARKIREVLGMTQAEFACAFGLSLGTVRDWEQRRFVPDRAARALLRIIEKFPVEAQDAMLPPRRIPGQTAPAAEETPDTAKAHG